MKTIKATNGPLEGQMFAVGGRALIGRDGDCDIQLVEAAASRKHACLLVLDDGSVLIRDLASRNGTVKDDEKVTEAVLADGDSFTVGDTTFVYLADAAEEDLQDDQIRLMSGPAAKNTTVENRTAEQVELMREMVAARTAAKAKETGVGKVCCGSPLTARARSEGWAHCPACGTAI